MILTGLDIEHAREQLHRQDGFLRKAVQIHSQD
jgi:N-acetylmuramic acid 6-phosphate etherase